MATYIHYNPDYKYDKARKLYESLPVAEIEDDVELLRYLLTIKDKQINELNEEIREYQDIFNKIGKFIPYKDQPKYG